MLDPLPQIPQRGIAAAFKRKIGSVKVGVSISKERHVIPGAIAAIIAAAVGFGSGHYSKPDRQITFMGAQGPVSATKASRLDRYSWGEMQQSEIDALTVELNKLQHRSILILCMSATICDDLALDFDNAFESAHWTSALQRPLFDDTIGIASNQPDVAAAIEQATKGRLKVSALAPRKAAQQQCSPDANGHPVCKTNDPPMLVIGKKP